MQKVKTYIGDSVYAEFNGYAIVLTTENGYQTSNRIVLEPTTYENLVDFVHNLLKRVKEDL